MAVVIIDKHGLPPPIASGVGDGDGESHAGGLACGVGERLVDHRDIVGLLAGGQ